MKKRLIISMITMAIGGSLFAQDKEADIHKLLGLLKSEKMIDEMMDNMMPIFKRQAEDQFQGEDAREKYEAFVDTLMRDVKELSNILVEERDVFDL